ncbi:hypothetical protein JOC34_000475 [Virgibacillus halotolerans]|uniref:hypothetical protein n=1 Tax=Virgibacillus halotolerans TaxID=1071053 RepID=UPI0019600352|nr:hypothetical protein [Virgibacillus halotolerans]MBM7598118.1 hypothetical protein [Virgibacillus halotolerans]
MNIEQFKLDLIDEGYQLTNNIHEGIWILTDGSMIDGVYDMGKRSEEHRMMESFTDIDRYDDSFWDVVVKEYSLVMIIPETQCILVKPWQTVTQEQQSIMDQLGYEVEQY